MTFDQKSRPMAGGEQAPPPDIFRQMLETMVQETIRPEFERFLGAARYERTPARRGRATHGDALAALAGSIPAADLAAMAAAIEADCERLGSGRKEQT